LRDLRGTHYFAVGVLHRRDGERDVHETAILGAPYGLEVIHTFAPTNACEHVLLFVEAVFWNDQRDAAPGRLSGTVAEDPLRGGVPRRDDAVRALLTMASSKESTIAAMRARAVASVGSGWAARALTLTANARPAYAGCNRALGRAYEV
jgi:hypothetical protein